MVLLKNRVRASTAWLTIAAMSTALNGCAEVTRVDYVDTDTYISSADLANHSELSYLRVSESTALQERTLLKLPTGEREISSNIDVALDNPLTYLFLPYIILAATFESMFGCQGNGLAASNLTAATLVLDVSTNGTGVSLSNQIQLELVAKPWWQNANWSKAHGFSTSGGWNSGGGDLDSSLVAIPATHAGTVTAGTLSFDVTNYFRTLIGTEDTPHYGMVLRSAVGSLAAVELMSTQSSAILQRPRVVSTYNCVQVNGMTRQGPDSVRTHTYILGSH